MNTAATTSAITYIDGDAGILRYRGYPIEQLAQHSSFLEVSYLLIYGNLPTPAELEAFDQRIRHHALLHDELKGFYSRFPPDATPGWLRLVGGWWPLAQGVALVRPLLAGQVPANALIHILALLATATVAFVIALHLTRRRLLK